MIELIIAAFLLGFLGSMHCVGMCGGLVTTLSMSRKKIWWSGLMAYQAGRIATYSLLGLIAGMIGMALTQAAWFAESQQILAIFAGLLMIVFGLNLAGWLPDPFVRGMAKITQMIGLSRWIQSASSSRMPMSWFMVGLFNGLLPCGLVYAGLALSLTSGQLMLSTTMMFAFGLGTVPAMTLVPFVLKSASPSMRGQVLKVAAILLVALGLLTMSRGGEWMHAMHGQHQDMSMPKSMPSVERPMPPSMHQQHNMHPEH